MDFHWLCISDPVKNGNFGYGEWNENEFSQYSKDLPNVKKIENLTYRKSEISICDGHVDADEVDSSLLDGDGASASIQILKPS